MGVIPDFSIVAAKQRKELIRIYSPRWSPDGQYVAAETADGKRLMIFDLTTQQWAALAEVDVVYWSWSQDGRYIYFDDAGNDPAYRRVRISDHRQELVVSLKNVRRADGMLGWWTGLAPDDSPLVLRDVGTHEIYASNGRPHDKESISCRCPSFRVE